MLSDREKAQLVAFSVAFSDFIRLFQHVMYAPTQTMADGVQLKEKLDAVVYEYTDFARIVSDGDAQANQSEKPTPDKPLVN